ncbi:MAG: GDSL-type esterase/lipase family protein [Bacteroidia bacterium]|nr:GDSL-type esterase/lipase family protein [Bacteroidia bacterium]
MNRLTVNSTFRLLVFSLILAGFLASCNVSRKYTKEASDKWEKDILKFEQLDKSEKDPDNAILFVGSSSIRLWSTLKEDVAPYPVIQRGFGGSKFSDLAVYAKRIVYPHQFSALVIFEANDITGSAADKSPEEIVKLFRNIVRTVRSKYPDQPVFLIEITPTQSRWAVWPTVKQTNQMLKESCSKMHNTYFIETASAYLNKAGEPRKELFIKDMLHQNHDGYIIWGELVKKKLDEMLPKMVRQ